MRFSTIATAVALIAASCHAFEASRFAGSPVVMSPTMTRLTSTTSALQMNAANSAPPLKRNPPRRICLMVEPTPFTHVSGYANRFKEMLKFLAKAGDEVDILTVDSKTPAEELPKSLFGFNIRHTQGFTFPLYNQISLTLDLPEMKGAQMIEKFKPDLIHVTSP
jgi:sulfoquinovosyltransferase